MRQMEYASWQFILLKHMQEINGQLVKPFLALINQQLLNND
jgi:hypothetical protein